MDDRHRWKRSRYASLAAVLALHAAVIIAFFMVAKTRFVTTPTMHVIELLTLPRSETPPERSPPPSTAHPDRQTKGQQLPSTPPTDSLTVVPTPDGNAPGKAVDWAQEAHDAAASIASRAENPPSPAERAATSPFAQPPAHHKGEQIPTADGRWITFVSEDCYQLSKEITHITNAANTGKAIQTYCNRRSKTPRGDLFKELPAYKKYHPDQ